jgi:hypothetical protein
MDNNRIPLSISYMMNKDHTGDQGKVKRLSEESYLREPESRHMVLMERSRRMVCYKMASYQRMIITVT